MKKLKFKITLKLRNADDNKIIKTVSIPIKSCKTYDESDEILDNIMNAVNPTELKNDIYLYYMHIYVSHEGIEFEKNPQIFPKAITFKHLECANEYINNFIIYTTKNGIKNGMN